MRTPSAQQILRAQAQAQAQARAHARTTSLPLAPHDQPSPAPTHIHIHHPPTRSFSSSSPSLRGDEYSIIRQAEERRRLKRAAAGHLPVGPGGDSRLVTTANRWAEAWGRKDAIEAGEDILAQRERPTVDPELSEKERERYRRDGMSGGFREGMGRGLARDGSGRPAQDEFSPFYGAIQERREGGVGPEFGGGGGGRGRGGGGGWGRGEGSGQHNFDYRREDTREADSHRGYRSRDDRDAWRGEVAGREGDGHGYGNPPPTEQEARGEEMDEYGRQRAPSSSTSTSTHRGGGYGHGSDAGSSRSRETTGTGGFGVREQEQYGQESQWRAQGGHGGAQSQRDAHAHAHIGQERWGRGDHDARYDGRGGRPYGAGDASDGRGESSRAAQYGSDGLQSVSRSDERDPHGYGRASSSRSRAPETPAELYEGGRHRGGGGSGLRAVPGANSDPTTQSQAPPRARSRGDMYSYEDANAQLSGQRERDSADADEYDFGRAAVPVRNGLPGRSERSAGAGGYEQAPQAESTSGGRYRYGFGLGHSRTDSYVPQARPPLDVVAPLEPAPPPPSPPRASAAEPHANERPRSPARARSPRAGGGRYQPPHVRRGWATGDMAPDAAGAGFHTQAEARTERRGAQYDPYMDADRGLQSKYGDQAHGTRWADTVPASLDHRSLSAPCIDNSVVQQHRNRWVENDDNYPALQDLAPDLGSYGPTPSYSYAYAYQHPTPLGLPVWPTNGHAHSHGGGYGDGYNSEQPPYPGAPHHPRAPSPRLHSRAPPQSHILGQRRDYSSRTHTRQGSPYTGTGANSPSMGQPSTPQRKKKTKPAFTPFLPREEYLDMSHPRNVALLDAAETMRESRGKAPSATKLLVLDLNGALIYRTEGGSPRKLHPRPYLDNFLEYVFGADRGEVNVGTGEAVVSAGSAPASVSVPADTGSDGEDDAPVMLSSRDEAYRFRPYEAFVWSSAMPHNVQRMVEDMFGPLWTTGVWNREQKKLAEKRRMRGEGRVLGVWARDKMGLSEDSYNKYSHTVKDLRKLHEALADRDPMSVDAPPSSDVAMRDYCFDESNTLLLDDSTSKAVHQPYNHVCMPEYDFDEFDSSCAVAQKEAGPPGNPAESEYQGVVRDAAHAQDLHLAGMDSYLLGIIGILDALRAQRNVAAWIRSGGMMRVPPSTLSLTGSEALTLAPAVPDDYGCATPSIAQLPSDKAFEQWYAVPEVLAHWLRMGVRALERRGIAVRHGMHRYAQLPSQSQSQGQSRSQSRKGTPVPDLVGRPTPKSSASPKPGKTASASASASASYPAPEARAERRATGNGESMSNAPRRPTAPHFARNASAGPSWGGDALSASNRNGHGWDANAVGARGEREADGLAAPLPTADELAELVAVAVGPGSGTRDSTVGSLPFSAPAFDPYYCRPARAWVSESARRASTAAEEESMPVVGETGRQRMPLPRGRHRRGRGAPGIVQTREASMSMVSKQDSRRMRMMMMPRTTPAHFHSHSSILGSPFEERKETRGGSSTDVGAPVQGEPMMWEGSAWGGSNWGGRKRKRSDEVAEETGAAWEGDVEQPVVDPLLEGCGDPMRGGRGGEGRVVGMKARWLSFDPDGTLILRRDFAQGEAETETETEEDRAARRAATASWRRTCTERKKREREEEVVERNMKQALARAREISLEYGWSGQVGPGDPFATPGEMLAPEITVAAFEVEDPAAAEAAAEAAALPDGHCRPVQWMTLGVNHQWSPEMWNEEEGEEDATAIMAQWTETEAAPPWPGGKHSKRMMAGHPKVVMQRAKSCTLVPTVRSRGQWVSLSEVWVDVEGELGEQERRYRHKHKWVSEMDNPTINDWYDRVKNKEAEYMKAREKALREEVGNGWYSGTCRRTPILKMPLPLSFPRPGGPRHVTDARTLGDDRDGDGDGDDGSFALIDEAVAELGLRMDVGDLRARRAAAMEEWVLRCVRRARAGPGQGYGCDGEPAGGNGEWRAEMRVSTPVWDALFGPRAVAMPAPAPRQGPQVDEWGRAVEFAKRHDLRLDRIEYARVEREVRVGLEW